MVVHVILRSGKSNENAEYEKVKEDVKNKIVSSRIWRLCIIRNK